MENNITPTGKLSKEEAIKSLRDTVVVWIWAAVPQIMEILEMTDFWEYSLVASVILAAISPLINRLLNWIRV